MLNLLLKNKVTFVLLIINFSVFGIIILSGDSTTDPLAVLEWGANFVPYTFDTEWWRLISSMFLHFGAIHLLANMYTLYILGTSVEKNIGSGPFIIVYFVSGFAAIYTSSYINLFAISAGASGALFGLYGFETIQVIFLHWNDKIKVLKILLNMVVYVLVISLAGLHFNFDNVAHFGGLFCGIVLGVLEVEFHFKKVFNRYLTTGMVSVFLSVLIYSLMPRFQVEYFKVFQEFIQTDKLSNMKYHGNFGSDNLYVKALEEFKPNWDTIETKLNKLILPIELEHDKQVINNHITLNGKKLKYMITAINQESYIYHDSLDVVSKAFSKIPALKINLNIDKIEEEEEKSEKEEKSPGKFTKQFYDNNWKEIPFELGAHFYRLGFKDSLNRWNGAVQDHYIHGGIQMKGVYKNGLKSGIFLYYTEDSTYSAAGRYIDERRVGKWQNFHVNGKLSNEVRYSNEFLTINTWDPDGNQMVVEGNGIDISRHKNGVISSYYEYKNGQKEGEAYGYYENGEPFYKEYYNKGTLQKGVAFSKDQGKHEYDYATYIPYPQGGFDDFYRYINRNKINPKSVIDREVSGEVEMIFSVDENGEISEIKFSKSLGFACDKEAKRLLLEGPEWIAGKDHGIEAFTSQTRIKISFP